MATVALPSRRHITQMGELCCVVPVTNGLLTAREAYSLNGVEEVFSEVVWCTEMCCWAHAIFAPTVYDSLVT